MSLDFGLMTLGDLVADPHTGIRMTESARHRQIVDQAVAAEAVGFRSVHLGEHHFSDYMLSSPPVVLSAIGERTSTLGLSTAVTLAGNLDPVRIAEDYATVDVLHDGRVELVLGRGNLFVRTYEGFGQPLDTARERYDEHVPLLTRLLREEAVTWQGTHRPPLSGHTTRPRPAGDMPIWIGAASRGSAELAADLGCRLMLPSVFGRPEMFLPVVEIYRARWEANGNDPAAAVVGACCHMHVGPTTAEARLTFEPHYRAYWAFVGELLGGHGMWPDFDFDELLAGPGFCGSPAEIVDKLGHWNDYFGLDRHLCMFDLGGMPTPTVMGAIERFGADVLPHFG